MSEDVEQLVISRGTFLKGSLLNFAALSLRPFDYLEEIELATQQPPSPEVASVAPVEPTSQYFIPYGVTPRERIFPIESRQAIIMTSQPSNTIDREYTQGLFTRPTENLTPNQCLQRVIDNLCRIHVFFYDTKGNEYLKTGSGLKICESGVILTTAHTFLNPALPNFDTARREPRIYEPKTGLITRTTNPLFLDFQRDFALIFSPTGRPANPTVELSILPLAARQQLWSFGFGWWLTNFTARDMFVATGLVDTTPIPPPDYGYEQRVRVKDMIPHAATSGCPIVNAQGHVVGLESGYYPRPGIRNFNGDREDFGGAAIAALSNLDSSRFTPHAYS